MLCRCAFGIVLHPEGEPPYNWTDRPNSDIVTRWASGSSCVIIAPNWAILSRHQSGTPTTLNIAGSQYNVQYNPLWHGGQAGTADFKLVRLLNQAGKPANLPEFASPYDGQDELNNEICIGGFGQGRGLNIYDNHPVKPKVIGYEWDGFAGSEVRWCTNLIEGTSELSHNSLVSEVLSANFYSLADSKATTYEGIIAMYDSGGGWFMHDGENWRIVGVSNLLKPNTQNASTFNPPDRMYAVRISSYHDWIDSIINTPCDLDGSDWVDLRDFALFAAQWMQIPDEDDGCDFNNDGFIDYFDLATLQTNWLTGWSY